MIEALVNIAQNSISQQMACAEKESVIEKELEGLRDLQEADLKLTGLSKMFLTTLQERIKIVS